MDWKIKKAKKGLNGVIRIPPDKSVSHRAVMYGSLSNGTMRVKDFLFGGDCLSTYNAFKALGIELHREGDDVVIMGKGLAGLSAPGAELFLGNSGTTMRIISGILAGQDFDTILTGDESLSARPMSRIIEPLRKMGADIRDIEGGGHAPLAIKAAQGPLTPIEYIMPVASAQVKSCILSAGLYADGVTMVKEPFPSRDHTERILEYFEADIKKEGLSVSVSGARPLVARDIKIPGDISSAAFFIVAASVVEGSDIIIKNVGLNPTRTGLINVLKKMGAHVEILGLSDGPEPWGDIRVKYSPLKGIEVSGSEIPLLIDEVPVLMIAALQAEGITRIKGIKELKVKESDRVFTMKQNVSLLGASIDEENDAVIINGGYKAFNSAELDSYGDHRIAMSMAVASLLADKGCVVKNTSCVNISYPGFIRDLSMLTS